MVVKSTSSRLSFPGSGLDLAVQFSEMIWVECFQNCASSVSPLLHIFFSLQVKVNVFFKENFLILQGGDKE